MGGQWKEMAQTILQAGWEGIMSKGGVVLWCGTFYLLVFYIPIVKYYWQHGKVYCLKSSVTNT